MNPSLWFLNTSYFTSHLTELWGWLRIYRVIFARSLGRTTANNNEVCHQSDAIMNHWIFNILNSTSFNIILICCWISSWLVFRFPHRYSVCISCFPLQFIILISLLQWLHITCDKVSQTSSKYSISIPHIHHTYLGNPNGSIICLRAYFWGTKVICCMLYRECHTAVKTIKVNGQIFAAVNEQQ